MDTLQPIKGIFFALLFIISLTGCDSTPEITDSMLDSKFIYDPSLDNPQDYLLSYSKPNPTPEEASRPVFIAIHGYSASTFEWEEFRTWSANSSEYYISLVLMGGHGQTYDDFKKATWRTWQSSIKEEYERLVQAGYTNLNFVGSSTSCTLILDLLSTSYFTGKVIPRAILFVDPIVIPSSKMLSLAPVIGPILGYIEADNTAEEDRYWYHFRPQETVQELNKVITTVRKQLENGIKLPPNCSLKVYKSIQDPTADPVSAVLIFKGVKTSTGQNIDVEMIDSKLHVFTRLSLRSNVSAKDVENQVAAFTDFIQRVL
jgi:carboxylesterase